jgi:chitodextrinase
MSIISKAREFRAQFVKMRGMVSDEDALQVQNLYPVWKADAEYKTGERVLYNEVLYKVLQDHVSQETWTPAEAHSLFAQVLIPDAETIYPWEQPDSTNTYKIGDKVTHNGKTWVSTVDNNSWEPGTYGWDEV